MLREFLLESRMNEQDIHILFRLKDFGCHLSVTGGSSEKVGPERLWLLLCLEFTLSLKLGLSDLHGSRTRGTLAPS
jgi:hypothetical protein